MVQVVVPPSSRQCSSLKAQWGMSFDATAGRPNEVDLYKQPRVLNHDFHLNLVVQNLFCYLSHQQYQHQAFTMKFDSQGGVSIFELLIYFPAIVVAAIVCSRHGFGRSSGWIFTLILCLVRIVGASCQLATYQSPTQGLLEAVIILESIGISPLLLATLGLLSRW
jgi:hypothetical protein